MIQRALLILYVVTALSVSAYVKIQLFGKSELIGESASEYSMLEFKLTDSEGEPFDLAEIHKSGKKTVIYFWATWCPSCKPKLPKLEKLYKKYAESGIRIVGVSIDDELETLQDFLGEGKYTFPMAIDLENEAMSKLRLRGVPVIVSLDEKGHIEGVIRGGTDKLKVRIEEWLKQ